MIKIVLYPPLAKGRQTVERALAEGEEISVRELISELQSNPLAFPGVAEYTPTDNPEQQLMILVNDKTTEGREILQKGDTIKLVSNMSGG
ncbi:MAG: MoaD/ThiS family protein [Candidatus Taylorbacteria bacterium]